MKHILSFLTITILFTALVFADKNESQPIDPKALIKKMTEKTGNYEKLLSLKDVQYTYTQRDVNAKKEDISIERYIFDGELSWAKYIRHDLHVLIDKEGEVIQGYNGSETWVTLDGKLVDDRRANRDADFLRKTNFYWFAMMQKLIDPGLNYLYKGTKTIDGKYYYLVEVTFDEGVGDVSDTYLLYINQKTGLIDQFLFTVMDYMLFDPYIMIIEEYKKVQGLMLPVKRKLTKSNWEGEILDDNWAVEIMADMKFNNGFKIEDFEKPNQ